MNSRCVHVKQGLAAFLVSLIPFFVSLVTGFCTMSELPARRFFALQGIELPARQPSIECCQEWGGQRSAEQPY